MFSNVLLLGKIYSLNIFDVLYNQIVNKSCNIIFNIFLLLNFQKKFEMKYFISFNLIFYYLLYFIMLKIFHGLSYNSQNSNWCLIGDHSFFDCLYHLREYLLGILSRDFNSCTKATIVKEVSILNLKRQSYNSI